MVRAPQALPLSSSTETAQLREQASSWWRQARAATAVEAAGPGTDVYTYLVPGLSPDGSCSLPDQLAPEPYSLETRLGGRTPRWTRRLLQLRHVLTALSREVPADWLGVYRIFSGPGGERVLVKLAYLGAPSRAEFPLTAAFAARSNNVAVALSGHPVVFGDVADHTRGGGAYYTCDARVRSEACLPWRDEDGAVAGIVDAESFQVGFFTAPRLARLEGFALTLGGELG